MEIKILDVTQKVLSAASIFCLRNSVVNLLDLNHASLAVNKFFKSKPFWQVMPFIFKTLTVRNNDEIANNVHQMGTGEIECKDEYISAAKTASWATLSVVCASLAFILYAIENLVNYLKG